VFSKAASRETKLSLNAHSKAPGSFSTGFLWTPLLSIFTAAFAVEIPFFFFHGTPSGHDVEFHLYSWLDVLSQWKQGILYPRWATLARFGYGEPRFIFYPPASWSLGAALSAIFPWIIVPDICIWICLVAAGASMFLLARQWLERRDAIFAAVLYAINPYHIVIVYWRSAFAELLASSLLPVLLLLLLRSEEKACRVIIPLALVLGSAWLINAPAAVMIHYSLALIALVIAWQRRSAKVLLVAAAAVVLGAALAAFYLLPAIYEQKWVNISEAISAGVRPLDNFLFVHTSDPEHDAFNRIISWIVLVELMATGVAAWLARSWRQRNRTLWYVLVLWAVACAGLMLPIGNPLWIILPKLRFMQFPWRWMLCFGIPFSLFLVAGVRRWTLRAAIYLAMLGVLILLGHHYQPPWWESIGDLYEIQDNMANGTGYEGTDEYSPIGADASAIDRSARRVTVEGSAHAAIRVSQWAAETKSFDANLSAAGNLALRLFNYPAWKVEVNGRPVEAGTREGTGQMLVPAQAGDNRVEISFRRTWDRTLGGWLSVLALLIILISMNYEIALSWIPKKSN
jgi:hypothetical protein